MQIMNATQMLSSADLMNSADGSSMSFTLWFYTTGVTYLLHFNAKTLKLRETWWKPQTRSAMPKKNSKLSAPIRCYPVFFSLGLSTSWGRDSCEVDRKYDWRPHCSSPTCLIKPISCVPWEYRSAQGDLGCAENPKRCLPGYWMVSPISGHAFVLQCHL